MRRRARWSDRVPEGLILLIFVICFAGNLGLAFWKSRPGPRSLVNVINEIGPSAETLPWPVTLHEKWPVRYQHQVDQAFAIRVVGIWCGSESYGTTHQMEYEEYGWPLPVLWKRDLWWPDDDPRWLADLPATSGLRVAWAGLILNPLLGTIALSALILSPPVLVRALRHHRRRRRGQCIECGYPLSGAVTCPECGDTTLVMEATNP